MKKLSTKWFNKWAKKVGLTNPDLLEAIKNFEKGLSVAELGANLYKVRVKRGNRGKSSGFRTIVVFKQEDRVVFLYGFGKNERANIDKSELQYFKKLGNDLLSLDSVEISRSITERILFDLEVKK